MLKKVTFESQRKAGEFASAVLTEGGDSYQWFRTSTVVMRANEVPHGFKILKEEPVTDYDLLMLNVGQQGGHIDSQWAFH